MVSASAKEIPFISFEIASHMAGRASQSSHANNKPSKTPNKGTGTTGEGATIADDEGHSKQLALIPMHPASKKADAKRLPIVLGRTNLAAWWWKSCPCQHYCRLHCRPVAQNVRSLSKVMIQIDTEGRVHIVGKNPHLVAIIPEREDNILHVQDIICIGRRDREPWMRFQVIPKPDDHCNTTPATGSSPNPTSLAPLGPGAINSGISLGRRSALPPLDNIHKNPALDVNASPMGNPPEWITTNTRKRNASTPRGSNPSIKNMTVRNSNSAKSGQIAQKQPQDPLDALRRNRKNRQEVIGSTSTIARVQRSYTKINQQRQAVKTSSTAALEPTRKRRRRSFEIFLENSSPKKASYRRNHRTGGNREPSFENYSVGTATPTYGDTHKRERTYVHLVFQDYQTSACLLEGNELRRKSESTINQATSKASGAESVVRQHQYGRMAPPRAFVADKTQLDLVSKNSAVSASPGRAPEEIVVPIVKHTPAAESSQDKSLTLKPEFEMLMNRTRNRLLLAPSDELEQVPIGDVNKRLLDSLVRPKDMDNEETLAVEESSLLSLPRCASSSFENGQGDTRPLGQNYLDSSSEAKPLMGPNNQVDSRNETKVTTDNSVPTALPSHDPIMNLRLWQDMVEQEERKGNATSFRHALASLVIAKNAERTKHEEEQGLLWLPPLLATSST